MLIIFGMVTFVFNNSKDNVLNINLHNFTIFAWNKLSTQFYTVIMNLFKIGVDPEVSRE